MYTRQKEGIKISFPKERLPSASKGEEISNLMRYDIISGLLKPYDKVSENIIAKTYHSSRSPAREALRILANEGLVTFQIKGAIVNKITRKDMKEINDLRFLVESFCMKECSKHANESFFAYLKYILDEMNIMANNKNYVELSILDISFHDKIIEASNHARFQIVWKSIRKIVLTALIVATKKRVINNETMDHLPDIHLNLIEAIKYGEQSKIDEALRIHFEDTKKTVLNGIFNNK